LWDWIPTVARLIYFFHPAAHYVAYRGRLERELACDQAAMALSGQGAGGYASTLVDVVARSAAPTTAGAALATARRDSNQHCPASTMIEISVA
jgi:beta-lactamase regulating signal transducer with metallopeptidase domain